MVILVIPHSFSGTSIVYLLCPLSLQAEGPRGGNGVGGVDVKCARLVEKYLMGMPKQTMGNNDREEDRAVKAESKDIASESKGLVENVA